MAYKAQQTVLQYGDSATPELFAHIAQITSISGPAFSNPTVDVTDLDATTREKISSSIVDGGQVTLGVMFDARSTGVMDAVFIDRIIAGTAAANFAICWSNIDATQGEATIASVDTGTEIITTVAAHGLHTGQPIRFTTSATDLPDPLVILTTYYAHWLSASTLTAHTTNAGAVADTGTVDITDAGTGTHKITMASKVIFPGIVVEATPTANVGEGLTGSITIDVTDSVTLTQ